MGWGAGGCMGPGHGEVWGRGCVGSELSRMWGRGLRGHFIGMWGREVCRFRALSAPRLWGRSGPKQMELLAQGSPYGAVTYGAAGCVRGPGAPWFPLSCGAAMGHKVLLGLGDSRAAVRGRAHALPGAVPHTPPPPFPPHSRLPRRHRAGRGGPAAPRLPPPPAHLRPSGLPARESPPPRRHLPPGARVAGRGDSVRHQRELQR